MCMKHGRDIFFFLQKSNGLVSTNSENLTFSQVTGDYPFDSRSLRFPVIEASSAARGGGTHADAAVGLSKF